MTKRYTMKQASPDPALWRLHRDARGHLVIGTERVADLALRFGTPLHIVHAELLRANAERFLGCARASLGIDTRVHYAFKCNSVPAIVSTVRESGLQAEVMSELEFHLALRLGFDPGQIIVNGPCKSRAFLQTLVDRRPFAIVVDSLQELERLQIVARERGSRPSILLRVNPDIAVRGVHGGSSTSSRRGCAFGLDLRGGEVHLALGSLDTAAVQFLGFHAHLGTGMRDVTAHPRLLALLAPLCHDAARMGMPVEILDLGGGFPSPTSRELSPLEMIWYQVSGRSPRSAAHTPDIEDFFAAIATAVEKYFPGPQRPLFAFEPGRSIVSNSQMLILSVEVVKKRRRASTWAITDGGIGTVALPAYYEYHDILLCDGADRGAARPVTIIGPGCFAADVIARNVRMPELSPGDILAVMDSGAYFTAMESNFGHPRPAVVAVDHGRVILWRSRESLPEFTQRDLCLNHNDEVQS